MQKFIKIPTNHDTLIEQSTFASHLKVFLYANVFAQN